MKRLAKLASMATSVAAIAMVAVACATTGDGARATTTTTPVTTATSTTTTTSTTTVAVRDGECYAGLELQPGDRCTYPGSTEDLKIDESGNAEFMIFFVQDALTLIDGNINGLEVNFVALRQHDDTWLVQTAG